MPRALSAVVVVWGAVGCFSPDYSNGGFPCGPNGECPSGFVCETSSSKCYSQGTIFQPDACVAETDPEFCTRQVKDCDIVSGVDNCGMARVANCGTCADPTPVCAANVCRAPDCGTAPSFTSPATVVSSASASGQQDALLGASADGVSVLLLRGTDVTFTYCVASPTAGRAVLLGDDPTGTQTYTVQDISTVASIASFSKAEESMTLSADGLTIIGVVTAGGFGATTRSAVGQTDFGAVSTADFANLGLPTGGGLNWPVISADGLAFYFHAAGSSADGIYEALRASTGVPFSAAQLMPAAVQAYGGMMGMSRDRLTAFLSSGFGTAIMTRLSVSDPFAVPAISVPPGVWRAVPVAGCTKVLGTCEPGGCDKEDICLSTKQ
jgi:hypothetical protein